jgi:hypothetical protein
MSHPNPMIPAARACLAHAASPAGWRFPYVYPSSVVYKHRGNGPGMCPTDAELAQAAEALEIVGKGVDASMGNTVSRHYVAKEGRGSC